MLAVIAELHTAATESLSEESLSELRALLDEAFDGAFSDHDWQNSLGGEHVWIVESGRIISHASLIERTLVCSGEQLQAGYVEAVATARAFRRRGHGARVMTEIGERIRGGLRLGALSTGEYSFYGALGWERWRGPTFVRRDGARARTPDDDGGIMILRTPSSPDLNLDGEIVCDWRPGDVW